MKEMIAGLILIACAFTLIGWGSRYESREKDRAYQTDSERGDVYEETKHQGDLDDIRRSQGEDSSSKNPRIKGSVSDF